MQFLIVFSVILDELQFVQVFGIVTYLPILDLHERSAIEVINGLLNGAHLDIHLAPHKHSVLLHSLPMHYQQYVLDNVQHKLTCPHDLSIFSNLRVLSDSEPEPSDRITLGEVNHFLSNTLDLTFLKHTALSLQLKLTSSEQVRHSIIRHQNSWLLTDHLQANELVYQDDKPSNQVTFDLIVV